MRDIIGDWYNGITFGSNPKNKGSIPLSPAHPAFTFFHRMTSVMGVTDEQLFIGGSCIGLFV